MQIAGIGAQRDVKVIVVQGQAQIFPELDSAGPSDDTKMAG